jgi:hypothetical protein
MTPKARLITLDIETYHTRNQVEIDRITTEALSAEPASNTRKDIKFEWDTEAARTERVRKALDKTAVDPLLAEPLCVCWIADDVAHRIDMMRGDKTGEPDSALANLAEALNTNAGPETIWIGHNILGFDLPVLLNAWRRAGIRPPLHFPTYGNGRWYGRVYDTMLRTPAKTPFVSLDDACRAYGLGSAKQGVIRGEEPMDGSMVGAAYDAGDYDRIMDYCMHDCLITKHLYLAMTSGDTWGTWDTRDDVAQAVSEIEAAKMSEAAEAIAIRRVLDQAGLIPRAAA